VGRRTQDDRPPESLGRYEIVSRLCVTATSEIFLAVATGAFGFRRSVVLKVLLREHADDPARVQAFVDEARIASLLQHANVVQVFDFGMDGGVLYLAMEHLDGLDARALLKRCKGALPLPLAMGVALGTCAALDYAHRARDQEGHPLDLVHRDVSASNVVVTRDGLVKLIDFGIARADARTARTEDGLVKGKLGYMSPEQCQGEPLDARTDVYGAGVLLFELVTGTTPHAGRDGYELLRAVIETDAPRARDRAASLPDSIDRILARALRRSKAERYATAGELLAELEAATAELGLDVSTRALGRCMQALTAAEGRSGPAALDPAARTTAEPPRAASRASNRARVPLRTAILATLPVAGVGALVLFGGTFFRSAANASPEPSPTATQPAESPPSPGGADVRVSPAAPEASTASSSSTEVTARSAEPAAPAAASAGSASPRRNATAVRPEAPSPSATRDLDAPLPP
jgi:eukaryotic-like serine/threonine-protein kinase